MKRYALALLPLLALSTSAFALVGGPFDNNTYGLPGDANTGTYQGTLTGKDVTGVMIFGSSSTSSGSNTVTQTSSINFFTGQSTSSSTASTASGLQTTGNEGRVAIFDAVTGVMVIGEMSSVIDVAGRRIAGVMEGSQTRSQQTIQGTTYGFDTNLTGSSISVGSTPSTQTFTFNDVVNIAGSFESKITGLFPSMSFEGNGTLTITAPVTEGDQVRAKQFGTSNVVVDGLPASQTSYSVLQPVFDEPRHVDVVVSGVKTSAAAPTFTGAVTVNSASVTLNQ